MEEYVGKGVYQLNNPVHGTGNVLYTERVPSKKGVVSNLR